MADIAHVSTNRKTIQDQVARHPLIAFVVLAYAITWVSWPLNDHIDLGMVNGFGIISLMGPALAAIIVSAVLRPKPSGVPSAKRWRLFGIVSILAIAVMAIVRLWHAAGLVTVAGTSATPVPYPTLAAFLMDVMAAVAVAFVLSGVYSPWEGVRDLLHSLGPSTQPARWYRWLLVLGFYPAVVALGTAISAAVGLPAPAPNPTGSWHWLAVDGLIMLPYFVFAGGGLEEPGWRGFALPWLQKKFSPLRSSLILAVLWACWHWPFLKGGLFGTVVYLLLIVTPLAILFTAVFNRTGGSLPIAILLHASINLTDQYLAPSTLATGLWMLLIVVIALWMWRSPKAFSFGNQELSQTAAAR